MERILITGAAGFLGSHLADRFLLEGYHVIGVDNLITGSPENIANLQKNEGFSFLRHDISTPLYIHEELDGVLHFASPASPVDYLELPIQTLKVGSLGTHNMLGLSLAKSARFLLASTSEVYGDPDVHPQPEAYWGNVNPVGLRGVYDEAKRFAEAMTMAYHRYHGVHTRIVRIFNSILADETVILFNDATAHIEAVEDYFDAASDSPLVVRRRMRVPAFNPRTLEVELREADALIKHHSLGKDAFRIVTRYGRHIRVTGDHSLFRRDSDRLPEAVPVRDLKVGDYIAIPGRLPVVERDLEYVDLAEHLIRQSESDESLWGYALVSPGLTPVLERYKEEIFDFLMESPRFDGSRRKRNTVGCLWRRLRKEGKIPLSVMARLHRRWGAVWPEDVVIQPFTGGGGAAIRCRVPITDDLLWLLGLFVAEGCHVDSKGTYRLLLSSDDEFVERACEVFDACFGVDTRKVEATMERGPSLYVDSKALFCLFDQVFQVTGASTAIRIPPWIFQLPLSRLKHFLEGYREGDGTHTGCPECRDLAFNTVSDGLATDLSYLLLRFGIVASVARYETTFRKKYGDRTFPFWRLTVCGVSNFDILTWDQGVEQRLNATRTGDLVWAKVREIEPVEASEYVYDFGVEGYENFLAGNGVFAHNTYGPRMRPADGRVVSNFIVQALRNEPLTVYGDGSQTRSFCYVDDEVEGIFRVFHSDRTDPTNIGNPHEFTIAELAELVLEETESQSDIEYRPLPEDDPKVRQPDISVAMEVLGWEAITTLHEGLKKTIPYFRELVESGDARARTLTD